ncbi:hypothetical protein CRI77_16910 [Mycolicibacterium duvalii]|uniref:Uncharacterized protein n=1 Tax=Mycolicibacterium duvalii TaxID=39688 RepID=A0A7I7K2X1_9MYCO|nr:hypothetical protein [Mycolicibacterium duvalii]MCV7368002.1 hypothetical protein [Mycolicibacterium duvalii]PEG39001.1 hypothetical protein CRI77_16910 [Mycolicibacterium duvalii]BBX18405.1 hypothetical protein MDUV_32650 [Mycolicibacterium duvalii]
MSNAAPVELTDVAFGRHPGRWPLPPAHSAGEHWLRAVAAAGQGRYASALTDLDCLLRATAEGPLASLAHSTRASFLRQLGWHDTARGYDGRGWALSGGAGEAAADALIGLAADALGVGRFAASARALARAADVICTADAPRPAVRLAWVSAELSMVRGDGVGAVTFAQQAVGRAEALGSTRHAVKSAVVLAAAHCSAGDLEASRRVAEAALAATEESGLVPLRWAVASLLADIGSDTRTKAQVTAVRDDAAAAVSRWGGVWRSR